MGSIGGQGKNEGRRRSMSIRDRSSGRDGNPKSTVLAEGSRVRKSWLGLLRLRLSIALGRKADPDGFVLEDRVVGNVIGQDARIERLASSKKPERLTSLLNEAVTLLEAADLLVIGARLSGEDESAIAKRIGVPDVEVGPLYAKVVDRLVERLAWVVSEEARGISPPERKVLGQARFFGRSAQEIASLLRLPEEVVKSWLREAGPPDPLEPGAPR
jgi:hypothetical protein